MFHTFTTSQYLPIVSFVGGLADAHGVDVGVVHGCYPGHKYARGKLSYVREKPCVLSNAVLYYK